MKRKKNIVLMYAISLLQGMVFYSAVATLYRQAQGVTVFQITLIESISLVLSLCLELPWGIWADRIGYKNTMVICCLLYFLSKLIFWQASGFGGFLLERLILSFVIAGLSGVDTSVLYLSCGGGDSQKVFGLYDSLQTAGMLAASLIFTLWIRDDYRLAALLTAVSYGIAAVLSLFLTEVRAGERSHETEKGAREKGAGGRGFGPLLRELLSDRRRLFLLAGIALLSETHQTVTVFLSQLQYVRAGMSSAAIGAAHVAVTLTGLCGAFSSRFTGKNGIRRSAVLLFGTAAVSCLLLLFTRNAMLSVCAVLALRLSFVLFQPLQLRLQNEMVTTADRATALSLHAMMIESTAVFTNVSFGALADVQLSAAFLWGTALCLTGLVCFLLWHRRYADGGRRKGSSD